MTTLKNGDIENGHGAIALQKIIDSHPDFRVRMDGIRVLRIVRDALRALARAKEELIAVFGKRGEDGRASVDTSAMDAAERAACLKAFDDLSGVVIDPDFTPMAIDGSIPKVAEILDSLSADELLELPALVTVS